MLISQQGMILRMRAGDVRAIGRATQGVRLIEMEEGDAVVSLAKLAEKEEELEPAAEPEPPSQLEPPSEPEPTRRVGGVGLGRLELGVFCQQLLHPDRVEAHGDLQIVVVLLDRDDVPDAELRVPDAHAGRTSIAD